jgi:class 3 adenylate cyclase
MTANMVICRSCGTALRTTAKFCDECGTPAAASVDSAQYKQVTVLFADVVRSMDIAAAVDIERLREIMTEVVERSATLIRRYGGTVEYNGDGVMALFGAPVALEDHAVRACLAALAIQEDADRLASEVRHRDGVTLQLRVGLDSGRVIAGELGSGSLGYAATGEHVGMAQRMESAAPPGGVMLSTSTAHLVEHAVTLAEPEWVHIKGVNEPVCVHRLLAQGRRDGLVGRADARLVGRRWEMAVLDALLDRTISSRGGVVNVVGAPGIGKSRVAREISALAARRGVEVYWTFCESHARDVPFHAVTRLLQAGSGVADLDGGAARTLLRTAAPANVDAQDLLLLEDFLGSADPEVPIPQIDPDARRRRLTALINTATLARTRPALYIVEDAHWIDPSSESMLVDLLAVVARTPTMVLITSRPEYEGSLTRAHGAQTIDLAPLGDSDTATLIDELMGSDATVTELAAIIADRAQGNPFFAEEMVRELVQRGVLRGDQGGYVCSADPAELAVPATVQAAIEARIDRLGATARQTLTAASVIGDRFEADLLTALKIEPEVEELLRAELVDQVSFMPHAEFAFRHPLIRAVAYESQLKSDRAEWHRRLAAAIEYRAPASADDNAAVIAEHLESAGDLRAAYGWHMRAASVINRDIGAARISWERARRIADQIPPDEPDHLPMRIAPRTMLCVTDWQSQAVHQSRGHFAELRELCDAAGDKVSLAIGMTGLATDLLYTGRPGEGSRLASEQMTVLESIGDPALTVGLTFVGFANWFNSGDFGEILKWSQNAIDVAAGDASKGTGFGIGSPLAVATAFRGVARQWLGFTGWRSDLHDAIAMARNSDPTTLALVVAWTYGLGIGYGVTPADDPSLSAVEEAVQKAEKASNDAALEGALFALGTALLHRDNATDRHRGLEIMTQARDSWIPMRTPSLIPIVEVLIGREAAARGAPDAVLPVMRRAVDELYREGRIGWIVCATSALVETLLARGNAGDMSEAEELSGRLAALGSAHQSAIVDITLLRVRTLLSRDRGDAAAFSDHLDRYREAAYALGFEGHIAWAEAMRT